MDLEAGAGHCGAFEGTRMLHSETFLLQGCLELASFDPLPETLEAEIYQTVRAYSIAGAQLETPRELTRLTLLKSGYSEVETGGLCIITG